MKIKWGWVIAIILYAMFLFLFLLAPVNAESFPVDTPINFSRPCINNNTYCSASAICNLTVVNPFGVTIVDNKRMTNQISFHNYTIPSQTQFGTYSSLMMCCDAGFCGSKTDNFDLTPNGETPTTPKSIFYIGVVAFLLVIFGVLVYAFKIAQTDVGKLWWFSLIWLWAIGLLFVSYNMARDFLTNNGFIGDYLYIGFDIFLFAFPFYILFLIGFSGYMLWTKLKINKLVEQGFNIDDATYRVTGKRR